MKGARMLVLSRERSDSIVVQGPGGGFVVTVLGVVEGEVSVLISCSAEDRPGVLDSWTAKLVRDSAVTVRGMAEVVLVDVREEKARIGIMAPAGIVVHRLEVYEAIRRENGRASGGEAEDGPAGSRVPRPGGPTPPELDVRLEEPGEGEE